MIWSFIKVAIFLALAGLVAFGADYMLDTGGEVRISFADKESSFSPLVFLLMLLGGFIAFWLLLKLIGLFIALLKFINGDSTAFSRYFDRNREKRGYEALSDGMIALAAGDGTKAMAKANKAERLLQKPAVTQLIAAQAAEISGDTDRAQEHFKELLKDDRTRFVGVRGLMKQKLDAGDTDTALKLAEQAFNINPRHDPTLSTLFALQSEKADWAGAKETLEARIRTKALPRDVGRRRDAILSLADAMGKGPDQAEEQRKEALHANKLVPGLIPAAALAARSVLEAGDKRQASKIITKAWTQNPHPDLAAVFAEIEPEENAGARLQRFRQLLKIKPDSAETKLLEAELNLAAEDFPAARKALGDLAETDPTARSLSIMAAIERGSGADEATVSGWLARALAAPRGDGWVCDNCNAVAGHWSPTCSNCESFDTLTWSRVPQTEDAQTMAAAMLPLLTGARDAQADGTTDTGEPDVVDLAAEATETAEDQARQAAAS